MELEATHGLTRRTSLLAAFWSLITHSFVSADVGRDALTWKKVRSTKESISGQSSLTLFECGINALRHGTLPGERKNLPGSCQTPERASLKYGVKES